MESGCGACARGDGLCRIGRSLVEAGDLLDCERTAHQISHRRQPQRLDRIVGRVLLPFPIGNLDWSPDSSRIVHQALGPAGVSSLFLFTVDSGTDVLLSAGRLGDADPSFSSDGSQIAFTAFRDGNPEIYVMRSDGSNVRRITNHPAFDNFPVFSPDDTQLAFQSNRDDEHVEVYLQNLNDGAPPRRITQGTGFTGFAPKAWSPDGTEMLVYSEENGKFRIRLIDVDPFPAELVHGEADADLSFPSPAPDGRQLLNEARLADGTLELRLTSLDTHATRRLFTTGAGYPLEFHLAPVWSPDNSLVAFCSRANGNSEIFTIRADGSGLRNVTQNPLRDTRPAFTADGREILFSRDAYGFAQLHRMNVDGTGQRRVTDAPVNSHELNPAVSPNGIHAAFAGDRALHGLDILMLDLHKPADERVLVSRRFHEDLPAFSNDGKQVAFVASSDGNSEIYVVNADGTGLLRLTRTKQDETAPAFSKDGRYLLFASNRTGRSAIYRTKIR
jgi:Tol biopolymer transport system component